MSVDNDSFRHLVDEDLYIDIIGNELLAKEMNRSPVEGFNLDKKQTWGVVLGSLLIPFFFYLIHLLIWNMLHDRS